MVKKISLRIFIFIAIGIIALGLSFVSIYTLKNENYLLRKRVSELSSQIQNQRSTAPSAPIVQKEIPSLVVGNESLFIADLLFSDKPWVKFTSDNNKVSFSYPENLFKVPQVYGENLSGLKFNVETYESWKKQAGENLDGISEGLGDPDSYEFNWEKQYDAYAKALKDERSNYSFGYELGTVVQKVKDINGIPFLTSITLGVNGSCDLEYVTYQKNTKVHFRANICDDPIFAKYRNFEDFKNKDASLAAQNILNGIDLDAKTNIKVNAIEQVIKTISVK